MLTVPQYWYSGKTQTADIYAKSDNYNTCVITSISGHKALLCEQEFILEHLIPRGNWSADSSSTEIKHFNV